MRALRESLRDTSSKSPESRALDFFLAESERDFEKALELSTGIYFEVLADDLEVTPGQSFNVTATVVNRSSKTIEIQQVLLESQWKHQLLAAPCPATATAWEVRAQGLECFGGGAAAPK